jgi:hypothetical protein
LPLLIFFFRGGSPILDGIAAYLRSVGVHGLVYPSARSDPLVRVTGGEVDDWSGWCFVDYRDAPHRQPARRVILNPDSWAETTAPVSLRLAPPDHPVTGSFALEDNAQGIAAVRRYDSELFYQRNYFRGRRDVFAPHFAVPGARGSLSVVQLRAMLGAGRVQLTTPTTSEKDEPSTVGDVVAAALDPPPTAYLEPHFRVDSTWFLYRVGTSDAALQIHCAVCDYTDLWPVHRAEQPARCPRLWLRRRRTRATRRRAHTNAADGP